MLSPKGMTTKFSWIIIQGLQPCHCGLITTTSYSAEEILCLRDFRPLLARSRSFRCTWLCCPLGIQQSAAQFQKNIGLLARESSTLHAFSGGIKAWMWRQSSRSSFKDQDILRTLEKYTQHWKWEELDAHKWYSCCLDVTAQRQWVRWPCFSGALWFMEDRGTRFLRWLFQSYQQGL